MKSLTSINPRRLWQVAAALLLFLPYYAHDPYNYWFALFFALLVWVNRWAFLVLSIPILVLNILFIHMDQRWGVDFLGSRIEVAMLSPGYETLEYIKSFFGVGEVFNLLYNALAGWFIYKSFGLKEVSHRRRIPVAIALLILGGVGWTKNFWIGLTPVGVVDTAIKVNKRLDAVSKRIEFLKANPLVENLGKCSENYQNVLVVIGESVTRHYMHAYGWKDSNTQYLESLGARFLNGIAPANQTRLSVPMLLTGANPQNWNQFYQSHSIVSDLRSCGYETHWVSNQGKAGRHESNITSIAQEAEFAHFLNEMDYSTAGYDGNILPIIDSIKSNPNRPKAMFIHLIGSHTAYSARYPVDSALISAKTHLEHYVNSIHYTDLLMRQMMQGLDSTSTLLVYTSDHGELPDKPGHGYNPSFKDEYEVPVILWGSQLDRIDHLDSLYRVSEVYTAGLKDMVRYLVGYDSLYQAHASKVVISLDPQNQVLYDTLSVHLVQE